MSRRAGALLFLVMAVLFWLANRAAYKGYFSDDELDNLAWTRDVPAADFALALVTPQFLGNNFRPVGHGFFKLMGAWAGLDFPKYVAAVHLLHFLNSWLVWRMARRLGAGPLAASLGTFFFVFHMALFDAYWKPMYIFDVACAFFCLASLLSYAHRRYVVSFVAFWLAYKSKELAVMLPAVLLLYEWWFGDRRWARLIPFFAVSLLFGVQGLLFNPNVDNDYTIRFTPAAVATTLVFYAPRLGLVLPAVVLLILVRRREAWFGLAAMALLMVPLLVLPGRLFGAYCYLPLAAFSLTVSLIGASDWLLPVLAAALVWAPLNLRLLRQARSRELFEAAQRRTYVEALAQARPRVAVYDGLPDNFHRWGVSGAMRWCAARADVEAWSIEDREARQALRGGEVALLHWDATARRLLIVMRDAATPDVPFITMDARTPLWQLDDGWYGLEGKFRWIRPRAAAHLHRPEAARAFELTVNIGPDMMREIGRTQVTAVLDGVALGTVEFTRSGWQTLRWPLAAETAGPARIELIAPAYHPANGDPRPLGVAVGAFGFRP